jgi:hypothetical protein
MADARGVQIEESIFLPLEASHPPVGKKIKLQGRRSDKI